MAREIDVDNLDADSVQYLRSRPWLIEEARLQGVDDIEERMTEVEEKSAEENTEYGQMKLTDLREMAKNRGVDPSGSRASIALRLTEQDLTDGHQTVQTPSAEGVNGV